MASRPAPRSTSEPPRHLNPYYALFRFKGRPFAKTPLLSQMWRLFMRGLMMLATAAALTSAAAVTAPAAAGTTYPARPPSQAYATANVVVTWNAELLRLVRTPGLQPATVHPTRSYAMMHEAILGAVDAVDGRQLPTMATPFAPRRKGSEDAAAASAAHDTLVALFPTVRSELDALLTTSLAQVPDGPREVTGVQVGRAAAAAVVEMRTHDGSDATPPTIDPGTEPGAYRPTLPDFKPAAFTHWAAVRPFVLPRADQFRPAPPPALTSSEYALSLKQVDRLGAAQGSQRTADQTLIARFWSGPPQDTWNEIAEQGALAHHLGTSATARLFAKLDLSLADATIAFYDAKYAYLRWRPVTAIHEAGTDANPATQPDPAWTPLLTTPANPAYPGAHSVISGAAQTVLARFFDSDRSAITVTSVTVPGVTRTFASYSDVAREAGVSRIYAGVHTRDDDVSGAQLGQSVAVAVTRVIR